jgi:hypothetical protein
MAAAAPTETTVYTDTRDNRNNFGNQYPVWQYKLSALWDADDTADATFEITLNGVLQKIILVVPNTTDNVTGQVVIKDDGGNTVFDSTEKAEATTYAYNVNEPLSGTWSAVLGISAAPGVSTATIDVYLRGV